MALLNLKKTKKTEKAAPAKKLATADASKVLPKGVKIDVIRRPHVSERASDEAAKGVYVFDVSTKATKPEIKAAVSAIFKVTVVKVRTVTIHPKRIIVKGRPGVRGGGKKAYVYLKKGEKIEVV